MSEPITEEEKEALAVLAKRQRILAILVPPDVPDTFVKRLTAWSNFILDTRLTPPIPLPVAQRGDGFVCPYCGVPSTTNANSHAVDCDWRKAVVRWGMAQIHIDAEEKEQSGD